MNHKDKAKAYEIFIKLYLSDEQKQMVIREYVRLRPLRHRWKDPEKYKLDCICYHQAFLNCKLYKDLELFNKIINKES